MDRDRKETTPTAPATAAAAAAADKKSGNEEEVAAPTRMNGLPVSATTTSKATQAGNNTAEVKESQYQDESVAKDILRLTANDDDDDSALSDADKKEKELSISAGLPGAVAVSNSSYYQDETVANDILRLTANNDVSGSDADEKEKEKEIARSTGLPGAVAVPISAYNQDESAANSILHLIGNGDTDKEKAISISTGQPGAVAVSNSAYNGTLHATTKCGDTKEKANDGQKKREGEDVTVAPAPTFQEDDEGAFKDEAKSRAPVSEGVGILAPQPPHSSEEEAPPPSSLSQGGLQRNPNLRVPNRPGAFTATGIVLEPRTPFHSHQLGVQPIGTNSDPERGGIADPATNEGLAVALPVDGHSGVGLPVASEFEADAAIGKGRNRLWLCFFIFGIMATVGVIVAARLSTRKNTSSSESAFINATTAPTAPPTTVPLESYILSMLPDATLKALQEEEEEEEDTFQRRAFEWLMEDPALPEYPDWRILQRLALAIFYHATEGPSSWFDSTDWLSYEVHECDWYATPPYDDELWEFANWTSPCGFEVGQMPSLSQPEIFQELRLPSNNIIGSLPQELFAMLPSLTTLLLYDNEILGSLPPNIAQLDQLTSLNMLSNKVTGTIPSGLWSLPKLDYIFLHGNTLSGSIPSQIGLLQHLIGFSVEGNVLSGTIPSEFGLLSHCRLLYLDRNQFTGAIPSEIGEMSALIDLNVGYSIFSSTIPTELGLLTNLWAFMAEETLLTGTLPTELSNLHQTLGILSFASSPQLSGSIPTEYGKLSRLFALAFGDTAISGPIPSEFGMLTEMAFLYLGVPGFTGTIPTELENLVYVEELQLNGTSLTGSIPPRLAPDAYLVNISGNPYLTGIIPVNWCSAEKFLQDCFSALCGCNCTCFDDGHNESDSGNNTQL